VPGRQLPDQLRLIEAITLALGREVRQTFQLEPRLRALPGLALDRLHRPPGCRLGSGHAGGRERLHG